MAEQRRATEGCSVPRDLDKRAGEEEAERSGRPPHGPHTEVKPHEPPAPASVPCSCFPLSTRAPGRTRLPQPVLRTSAGTEAHSLGVTQSLMYAFSRACTVFTTANSSAMLSYLRAACPSGRSCKAPGARRCQGEAVLGHTWQRLPGDFLQPDPMSS